MLKCRINVEKLPSRYLTRATSATNRAFLSVTPIDHTLLPSQGSMHKCLYCAILSTMIGKDHRVIRRLDLHSVCMGYVL